MKKIYSFFVILMMFILVNSGMCFAVTMSGDKMVCEIPYIYEADRYVYNTTEQTADLNLYDSRYMTVNNNKRTLPGTQNVIVSLNDKENYIWADGTSGDIELEWKISKAKLVLEDYCYFRYNGNEKKLYIANVVSSYRWTHNDAKLEELVTISGGTATDIGVYKATLSLNDKVNSLWKDGTSGDKEFLWEIKKGQIYFPDSTSVFYNGKEHTLGDEQSYYFDNELMEFVSGAKATEIGNYQAVIALKDKDRYEWRLERNGEDYYTSEDQVVDWEIIKGGIGFSPNNINGALSKVYTGEKHECSIKDMLRLYGAHTEYYGNLETIIDLTGNVGTDVGKYTATFSLKDTEHYCWYVEDENGDWIPTEEDQTVEWEITRKRINPPTLKKNLTYNGKIQYAVLKNFDESIMNIEGNSARNAGEYTAVVSLENDNYEWRIWNEETGEYDYTTEPQEIEWKIEKVILDIPYQKEAQEYSGKSQKAELIFFDEATMRISGDTAKECGKYTATVTLLDKANYAWKVFDEGKDDYINTSVDQSVEWRIIGCTIEVYKKIQRRLEYTGEEQTPEDNLFVFKYRGEYVTEFELPSDAIEIRCDDPIAEVGIYSKLIVLIDTENYRWKVYDGDEYYYTTQRQRGDWEIVPAELEIYKKVQRKLEYTGEEQTPKYMFEIGYRNKLWNENELDVISVSGDKAVNSGRYLKTLSLINDENYVWKIYDEELEEYIYTTNDQVAEWIINKISLDIPVQKNNLCYDGSEQTANLRYYDNLLMNISGDKATDVGIHTAEVALKDSYNYCWSDGTSDTKYIEWEINKGTLDTYESSNAKKIPKYIGEEIIYYPIWFDEKTMNISGNVATLVGEYTLTVSIKEPDKYSWDDETTDDITYSWEIQRGDCELDVLKRNLVIGKDTKLECVSTPNVTDGVITVLYEVFNNGGTYTETMPTEEGLYKVKLSLTGDSNLLDSVHEEYIFMKKDDVISGDTSSGDANTPNNSGDSTIVEPPINSGESGNTDSSNNQNSTTIPTTPTIQTPSTPTVSTNRVSSGGGGGGGATTTKYKIDVIVGNNGNISPKGSIKVIEGTDKLFEITAKSGYVIKDVLVDGKSVGKVTEYVFVNVTKEHSIEAIFEKASEAEIVSGDTMSGDTITDENVSGDVLETNEISVDSFEDINSGDWYYDATKYVVEQGLFKGVSESEFAPETTMDRAMIVTVLHRLANEKTASSDATKFNDVSQDTYYYNAVNWAVENGIVNGVNENTFAPSDSVTREQLVVMLYRFAKLNGTVAGSESVLVSYEDANEIESYVKEAFAWAISDGIITGKSSTILAPKDTATRAEVATMLMRFEK